MWWLQKMVTRDEYLSEILCSISELWGICTSCGDCCRKQSLPLHSLELPYIIHSFDSEKHAGIYIRRNPYPFNIQTEYYFRFDSVCPFLDANRCHIYSRRPLVCRLFPIRLEAFLDYPSDSFREPMFQIVSGQSSHSCMTNNIMFLERLKTRALDWGKSGAKIIDYIVSTIVDDLNFAYLFGQEPKRDNHAFSPDISKIKSEPDFASILLDKLFSIYHRQNLLTVEVWNRLVPLNDIEITSLRSDECLLNSKNEVTLLFRRMEKKKHPLLRWRKNFL